MNEENKITELEARIDKLEHAILVMVSWSHGQADYIRDILTPGGKPDLDKACEDISERFANAIADDLFKNSEQIAENVLKDVQGLLNKLTRE